MNKIEIKPKRLIIIGIIVLLVILLIIFIIICNKNDEPEENEVKTESNELNENETNLAKANDDTNEIIDENDVLTENSTKDDLTENDNDEESDEESLGDFVKSDKYESVISPTTFYTVKEYIDDFFNCIANSDNSKLMNILDEEYISQNAISSSNVNSKLEDYNYSYTIEDIYEYAYTDNLRTFLAKLNQNDENRYVYFSLDYATGAYKIYIGEDGDYINEASIEINEDNQFKFTTISTSTMCKNYLNMYIEEMQNNVKESYYLLDKEYREEAFNGIDDYVSYINENIDMYSNASVSKYKSVMNTDNSMEYTIVDNYGNYYIVNATSVMNYTIRLSK